MVILIIPILVYADTTVSRSEFKSVLLPEVDAAIEGRANAKLNLSEALKVLLF